MRAVLLGGTGFIGTPLAGSLRAAGVDVLTVGRSASADVAVDLAEPDALEAVLRRESADVVVNLAGAGLATQSVSLPVMAAVNAGVPERALRAVLDLPTPPAFVHAASSTERQSDDEPDESDYSRTKHEGAQAVRRLARDAGGPVVLVRVHNTYGPGQPRTRFVAWAVHELAAGRPVRLNHPDRVRDFVFVDDVVSGFARIVADPAAAPREVELGTGIGTSLRALAVAGAELLDRSATLVESGDPGVTDPHPYAVAAEVGGTLGTCRTTLGEGLTRTVRE